MQAWANRFYATPDGMSYLDLSDAVLTGHFGELLNAYWSPLYPALIGVVRFVLRPSAYWEFAVIHLLNFLLFAVSLAAFEYFLRTLQMVTREWNLPALSSVTGTLAAYALFGAFSLMMTPLTLPTPDLLISAACFVVFGALLRLRRDPNDRRAALILGVALAVGSLAKSFIVPWAVVCLLVAWLATRRSSRRVVLPAVAVWLVAVVPWSVALSTRVGHPTFGDTGRLTYIWYVNQVESPSDRMMPHAAATPATDSILPGVAITPNAPGTNPIWYDPARWYSDLHPVFEPSTQLRVFSYLLSSYIVSLGPVFLVVCVLLGSARRADRNEWASRAWVVMVPCIVAILTYSMVLVTTRYVAPFYVAMILMIVAGLRWPTRVAPGRLALTIGVPLTLMALTITGNDAVSVVNAGAAAVLFSWTVHRRGVIAMVLAALLGLVVARVLQPGNTLTYVFLASAIVALTYWLVARRAYANGHPRAFTGVALRGLLIANAGLVLFVAGLKYRTSLEGKPVDPLEPNDNWTAAQAIGASGAVAGERLAVIGSPFDIYWARTARLKVVAVVSPRSIDAFVHLSPASRGRLLAEFRKAGATRALAQTRQSPDSTDTSWVPVSYVGWVKRLP